ncbi:MAG: hypothetical protein LBD06_06335 [Candidatus Accumulibacter sp.]|nr:hypothetical protein [Accumulibacter sp.]
MPAFSAGHGRDWSRLAAAVGGEESRQTDPGPLPAGAGSGSAADWTTIRRGAAAGGFIAKRSPDRFGPRARVGGKSPGASRVCHAECGFEENAGGRRGGAL